MATEVVLESHARRGNFFRLDRRTGVLRKAIGIDGTERHGLLASASPYPLAIYVVDGELVLNANGKEAILARHEQLPISWSRASANLNVVNYALSNGEHRTITYQSASSRLGIPVYVDPMLEEFEDLFLFLVETCRSRSDLIGKLVGTRA